MKDRIKMIRKAAGLNQSEFADMLGLSRSLIAQVETDKCVFSDRSIRDICRMFSVNEDWLRTGAGEPYKPKSRNIQIAELLNDAMEGASGEFKTDFIYALASLDSEDWVALERVVDKIISSRKKEG